MKKIVWEYRNLPLHKMMVSPLLFVLRDGQYYKLETYPFSTCGHLLSIFVFTSCCYGECRIHECLNNCSISCPCAKKKTCVHSFKGTYMYIINVVFPIHWVKSFWNCLTILNDIEKASLFVLGCVSSVAPFSARSTDTIFPFTCNIGYPKL